MIKTVANRSLVNIMPRIDLLASPSGSSKTINIPIIPKAIDEQTNIRVAIFCIALLYIVWINDTLLGLRTYLKVVPRRNASG